MIHASDDGKLPRYIYTNTSDTRTIHTSSPRHLTKHTQVFPTIVAFQDHIGQLLCAGDIFLSSDINMCRYLHLPN